MLDTWQRNIQRFRLNGKKKLNETSFLSSASSPHFQIWSLRTLERCINWTNSYYPISSSITHLASCFPYFLLINFLLYIFLGNKRKRSSKMLPEAFQPPRHFLAAASPPSQCHVATVSPPITAISSMCYLRMMCRQGLLPPHHVEVTATVFQQPPPRKNKSIYLFPAASLSLF
jgi:hypothetical protein